MTESSPKKERLNETTAIESNLDSNLTKFSESYSSSQKIHFNIIKRSEINLSKHTSSKLALNSSSCHENENSYYAQGRKQRKTQYNNESTPKVYKAKYANTKLQKNDHMRSEPSIHKPMGRLHFKQSGDLDDGSDMEEGVFNLMTPLIAREPKTITKVIRSKLSSKMKSGKSRYKYLSKPFKINL